MLNERKKGQQRKKNAVEGGGNGKGQQRRMLARAEGRNAE